MHRMEKTDTILLIYKKGGLQPSVAPSPPQPSNLSISQSGDVLINKFSMNLFDLWPSHYNNDLYFTSMQKLWQSFDLEPRAFNSIL